MDLILFNGGINTLDGKNRISQAVGVSHGLIEEVGDDREVLAHRTLKTEVIDLGGAALFPGFMESHCHLTFYAYMADGLDLSPPGVGKMEDVVKRVGDRAGETPPGGWIKGSRYAEYFLAENRHPTRYDLDPVSPDHPVILYHTSFHAAVLNSRALEIFKIGPETPNPYGGLIEKDPASGEPTGVLHDAAMALIFDQLCSGDLETMTKHQRVAMFGRASEYFAQAGLVAVSDALVQPFSLEIYQDALEAGRLKTRVYTMNLDEMADPLIGSRLKTGFGSGRLRIGPIKIFADGGMSNRTAAVSEPYLVHPGGKGLKIHAKEDLMENVGRYHRSGWQIAVHAQGDEALADILDAFQSVLGPESSNPLRHRIEHAGCLYPDLLSRAARMNIGISVQPVFFKELGDGFLEAFGPERAHRLYPFKSMLNAGLHIGGSSDCPVATLDPRLGLSGAMMRRTAGGVVLGADQKLSLQEAVALYTRQAAWLSFDEDKNGSIEPGKRADFTVMATDPALVDPEEIPQIPIVMTVVDGEIVHRAD